MNKIILLLITSILIFSCNSENSSNSSNLNSSDDDGCIYSLNPNNMIFEWVAFKTTEKLAVKGTFEDVRVNNEHSDESIQNMIINTKLEISLNTVSSGNEDRDGKLVELFFQNLEEVEIITGIVEEAEGNNEKGKIIVALTLNKITHQVMMNYKVEEKLLKLHGGLDLLNWKTEKSIDALHEACMDLHTGADGISKTWSTMEINIHVPLEKQCK